MKQSSFNIQHQVSLKPYNTFGIDVSARFFTTISNDNDLRQLITGPVWRHTKKLIIGGGSNLLFTQDFDGLVIHNKIPGIQKIAEDNDHVWLTIGAGENWHEFVLFCVNQNYAGIENLSLIPGSVGAAPMQNIGAYGVELKQVFEELNTIHLKTGKLSCFKKEDCQFGYRTSIFKTTHKNEYIITNITLRLNKKPTFQIDYGSVANMLKEMNTQELSIKAISDAVIKIRQSKLPDPKQIGNAGSFFKNPEINSDEFHVLQRKFPDMPFYPAESNKIKIPAGWLIEQCGWKGKRFGDIGVFERQALVLVNYGQANGHELKKLAADIQSSVLERFSIELVPEVNIID